MASIHITLPDDVLSRARQQAAAGGFAGIEEFVSNLVTERLSEDVKPTSAAPENLRVHSREQLNKMILEGASSAVSVMTAEDFAAMRRELVAKVRDAEGT